MIFIIIPAYNEEKHIAQVIRKTKKQGYKNIIVVDDGSRDKTAEIAKKQKVVVLKHIVNIGKGAALKTGCDYALNKGADIMVVMDADNQHKPEEIKHFLKAIKKNDIVFGSRKLNRKMPLIMRFGNWFINIIAGFMYGVHINDTQSGFRCFTANAYKKIRWTAIHYDMESEMIANVGRYHLKYTQIPIETIYSDKYKGTTILDGIKIVFKMLMWKFKIRQKQTKR